MTWRICSVALMFAAVISVAVGAYSGTNAQGNKDKTAKKGRRDSTYTGCIEAGSTAGSFRLTHVAADSLDKGTVNKKGKAKKEDTTVPAIVALTSASVDLRPHVGHRVSVTGSLTYGPIDASATDTTAKDPPTLSVKSLKMVAASCS